MASPRETLCTMSVRVRDNGCMVGTWEQNQANKESSEQALKGENGDTNRAFSTRQKFSVTDTNQQSQKVGAGRMHRRDNVACTCRRPIVRHPSELFYSVVNLPPTMSSSSPLLRSALHQSRRCVPLYILLCVNYSSLADTRAQRNIYSSCRYQI